MKILMFMAALLASTPALAADQVALSSDVLVERTVTAPDGKVTVVREEPKLVTPGDKLVFVLSYTNSGTVAAESFVVTNPIPSAVSFVAAETPGSELSADGGKVWGALEALKVKDAEGKLRPAVPADVTHIRWAFAKPIPVGASGKLSFKATVR